MPLDVISSTDGPCPLPAWQRTEEGLPRRVGVEAEFTGISVKRATQALADALGGRVVQEDAHAWRVIGCALGDLRLELDMRHLHPHRREETGLPRLGPRTAALAGWLLQGAVPAELVSAPLPIDQFADVDLAIAALRRAGARGAADRASLGLHLNVEAPRLDAGTLTSILKAYLLLEPWLMQHTRGLYPGWPGRGTPSFPEPYVRHVLAPGYQPDLPTFAADYLRANPTRDRGLDLLPILLHLDESLVRAALPFEKIGGRPAFHFRLPLARVGDPTWSIMPSWRLWERVEALANTPDLMAGAGRERLEGGPCAGGAARLAAALP